MWIGLHKGKIRCNDLENFSHHTLMRDIVEWKIITPKPVLFVLKPWSPRSVKVSWLFFFNPNPHRSPSFVRRWTAINNITTIHIFSKAVPVRSLPFSRKPFPSQRARWPGWCITLGCANLVLHARARPEWHFPRSVYTLIPSLCLSVDALFSPQKCIIFPAKRASFFSLFLSYFSVLFFFFPKELYVLRPRRSHFALTMKVLISVKSFFLLQCIVCKLCFNICLLYSFATLSGAWPGGGGRSCSQHFPHGAR